MQELLNLLFWIGTIAGGLMIILLLISVIGGMEIGGDVDVSTDAGGSMDGTDGSLGIVKTLLTFISVGAFTARAIFLNTSWSWTLVILAALVSGAASVLLLGWFFRWLLKNQEEGNWQLWQAEGKTGSVYVPIPAEGKGRIQVQINDAVREIAAQSQDGRPLATHDKVLILEAKEDYVIVAPYE